MSNRNGSNAKVQKPKVK